VIVAAKAARARSTRTTSNLGGGKAFDESRRRWVETGSKNYLTIALEEVAAGQLKYHYR